MLRQPKFGFPGIAEDIRNFSLLPKLNPVVEILERPAQSFPKSATNTAFAGAHETDQNHGAAAVNGSGSSRASRQTSDSLLYWHFRTRFAPIRFAVRFTYCFSERFLR